jgi:hypothetical protein
MSGIPTTQAEITTQAQVMALTGKPTANPRVKTFDRFTCQVQGTTCQDQHPNGHITPLAATKCGQARCLAILEATTQANRAKVGASLSITLLTLDRYMCLTPEGKQGCKFGHKDMASALACVGAKSTSTRALKATFTVKVGGKAPLKAGGKAIPIPIPTTPRPSLKASQGGIGGRGGPATPTTTQAIPTTTQATTTQATTTQATTTQATTTQAK